MLSANQVVMSEPGSREISNTVRGVHKQLLFGYTEYTKSIVTILDKILFFCYFCRKRVIFIHYY